MKQLIYTIAFLLCAQLASAQKIDRNSFATVDKYVADLGPMDGHMLKYIVDTLTHRQQAKKADQVRAIYMWIANNIVLNTRAQRHPGSYNHSASVALNERSTTSEGYANLFKTMTELAHVNSMVIKGVAKRDARSIGKLGKWDQHVWNAVNVGGTWYLLDLAWSAGTADRKYRFFTKSFTDAWFFTDRELFALSHYPTDKKWQLLDTPINKSQFNLAPIVGKSAVINEVYPSGSLRANVRGKADTTKKMTFEIGNANLIKSVSVTGRTSEKTPARYTVEGDLMHVEVPFKSTGDYPFNIYVNDVIAYTYKADVSEARKKPKPKAKPQQKKKPIAQKKKPVDKKDATTKGKKDNKEKKEAKNKEVFKLTKEKA